MSPKKKKSPSPPRTWRDLKRKNPKTSKRGGPSAAAAETRNARWRKFSRAIKKISSLFVVAALAAAAWFAHENWDKICEIPDKPLSKLEFKSDGVLNEEWFVNFYKVPKNLSLSEIDIFEIKEKLENVGQIHHANVERKYPDTLKISVFENSAFARINPGDNRTFALSRDGLVFKPQGDLADIAELFVEIKGAKMEFDEKGRTVCPNAQQIAEFLDVAKRRVPEFFKSWKVVDSSQVSSITLPVFTVTTSSGLKIVFLARDYDKQFDRLEYVLRYAEEKNASKFEKIDLTLKDRAIVKKAE